MSRPRRLLTLGHSYVVGTNRALAQALAEAGAGEWEVTAAAPARYPGDLGELALAPTPGAAYRLEPLPARVPRLPQLLRYGAPLRRLLREPWDVVHCWEEPFVYAAWQVARWAPRGARLVYASFQNLAKRYPPPFALLERRVMRRADGWIAFGETVREALADRAGYRERPHVVIAPGVDTTRFRPDPEAGRALRARLGWADDALPVVGYLGRFVEAKGLRVLLRAMQELPARVLLVGGGPLAGELRRWAAALGDRGRVLEGVPHAEVPACLNAMHLLAAPSLTTPAWREQFGRMALEAMACGVPVVASRSGELPHLLGDAGTLVPEADPAALAAACTALLGDAAERERRARAGLARVGERFALPVVARRHLDFFERLMSEPARRG